MSSRSHANSFGSRWTGWAPLAVLLLGATCTAVVAQQLVAAERERDRQRFDGAARRLQSAVERRVGRYEALARVTARLLSGANGYLGPDDFHRFLTVIRPPECLVLAGVEGVGYCRRIKDGELPYIVQDIRRDNYPAFKVTPALPKRPDYFPVVLQEPPAVAAEGKAGGLLGYDPFAEPNYRHAMERARDSGAVAACPTLKPLPARDAQGAVTRSPQAAAANGGTIGDGAQAGQAGLVVVAPVYGKDAHPADLYARRAEVRGFVYVLIRAADALDSLRAEPALDAPPDVEFAVHVAPAPLLEPFSTADGAAKNAPAVAAVAPAAVAGPGLIYQSPGYASNAERSRYSASLPISVAGWNWVLTARSTPAFEAGAEPVRVFGLSAAPAVAVGGGAVSLALALLTWLLARGRGAADRAAGAAASAADRLDLALRQAEAGQQRAEAERDRSDRSRQHAEGAGRVKDQFLATLSHELRTPLNAMLGWVQLLRRQSGLSESVDEGLAVIERNARVQSQLVSDLLDMSRIIAGKVHLDLQPVDLAAVAAAAADSARPAAEAKSITLERVTPEPAAPAALADLTVWGDGARLQQIAWNLLTNAIKFTPAGGRVRVAVARTAGPDEANPRDARDARVTLTVTDTGEGIPREFLPHLFDRFAQADAGATRRHGGLGLGLAIVRHLVELHGGRVWAASEGPGKGSTFTVEFPAAQPRVAGHGSNTRPADAAAHPALLRVLDGLTVLVADDEPDARDLARRVLSEAGAAVLLAPGASEALRLLRDRRPDVLVGDIGMPDLDGYSLARAVRALPESQGGLTPALALTAFAGEDDARRALAAGYHVHLPKPAEAADLVAAVARLAGRDQGPASAPAAATAGPTGPAASEANPTRRERLGLNG